MPIDPRLGYDPRDPTVRRGLAPGTIEQWASDWAMTQAAALANGTASTGPGSIFDNNVWSSLGLPLIDPGAIANGGVVGNSTYNLLMSAAMKVASQWDSLPASARTGFSPPTGLPSGGTGPGMSAQDQQNIFAGTQAGLDREHDVKITGIREGAETSRNAARIAAQERIAGIESKDRRYATDVNAQVNREDIAARERISSADRASRENIATADRTERAREFDLQLGEDRRKTTLDFAFRLFDRGIELAANPVDWVAYDYWINNLEIPMNLLTLSSAAAVFGAIPPSGPSGAGPVIGGPAAIDGDFTVAQQMGIQNPGPVPVSIATQTNPGSSVAQQYQLAAQQTVDRYGGAARMDSMVTQAMQSLPPGTVSPQYLEQARTAYSVNPPTPDYYATETPPMDMGRSPQGLPPLPGDGASLGAAAAQIYSPPPSVPPPLPPGASNLNTPPTPGAPIAPMPGMMHPPPLPNVAGAQPGMLGGIHTGNEVVAAGPPANPQVVAQAQQMFGPQVQQTAAAGGNLEQLFATIASQMGMSMDQVRQLFPIHLMPGQYSREAVANQPVLRSLRENGNTPLSAFNTSPMPTGAFTNIKAIPGAETGIRGGQDYNATTYLTADPALRGMVQGAIRGQGQYLPSFEQQLYRSAPITNLNPGDTARRRY